MALATWSSVKIPLPYPTQEKDTSSLGTATAQDTTGKTIDMSKHVTGLLTFVPTTLADMTIRVQGSSDGTNYDYQDDIVFAAGSTIPVVRWYTGWELLKVTVPTYVAGTVTIRGKLYPWAMAGNYNPVSIGP